MHEEMLKRWNNVVSKQDVVFHLGDVAFSDDGLRLLSRLNGTKKLILGNHDQHKMQFYIQYFSKIYGVKYWEKCILSHVPVHPHSLGHRAILNIHGHLHSKTIPDDRYLNVGVELNDLTPVHSSKIKVRIEYLQNLYNERME